MELPRLLFPFPLVLWKLAWSWLSFPRYYRGILPFLFLCNTVLWFDGSEREWRGHRTTTVCTSRVWSSAGEWCYTEADHSDSGSMLCLPATTTVCWPARCTQTVFVRSLLRLCRHSVCPGQRHQLRHHIYCCYVQLCLNAVIRRRYSLTAHWLTPADRPLQ